MNPTSDAAPSATRALQIVGASRKRVLDPVERFSEIIFGLIMVLTFTGALSVAESGRQEVREMIVGALACNVAWGLVDGVMYLVTSVVGRARQVQVLLGIREAGPAAARAIVTGSLPEGVASITDEAEADRMVARLRALPEPSRAVRISGTDLRGALGSGLLVVLATFPPIIPFLLIEDAGRALRTSNGLAVVCLFLAGYFLGKATGVRAGLLGLTMVLLGSALVGITMALGG